MRYLRYILIPVVAIAVGACGSSSPSVEQTGSQTGPDSATVAKWPVKWCSDVHAGQDRSDVVATMGTPTETYPDQDQWSGFGYHFTAFYDETGTVRQLDVNDLSMSEAQKSKLTCDDIRS